jgi:drug/metabolite transporter (DMT)-like permease
VGDILYVVSYRQRSALSQTAPVTLIMLYVLVSVCGGLFFRETISPTRALGLALGVLSVYLIA